MRISRFTEEEKADRMRAQVRDYMRMVQSTVLPPHPFNKQTCCRDCRRTYTRDWMRDKRKREKRKKMRAGKEQVKQWRFQPWKEQADVRTN